MPPRELHVTKVISIIYSRYQTNLFIENNVSSQSQIFSKPLGFSLSKCMDMSIFAVLYSSKCLEWKQNEVLLLKVTLTTI